MPIRSRLPLLLSLLAVFLGVALPATAAASTRGFTIYNFSSQTFSLAEIRGLSPDKPPIFESGPNVKPAPKVGDVLAPGDVYHVELEYTGSNGARLLWRRPASSSPTNIDLSVLMTDTERPKCNGASTFECKTTTENIGLFDPKGMNVTIGSDHPRDQADILRALCRSKNLVPFEFVDQGFERNSCDYDYESRDKSAFGSAVQARPIVNCGAPTKALGNWWAEDKVGFSTNTGIESLPGTDLDFIMGKIKRGVPAGTRFDDFTFNERFSGLVNLFDATYVTAQPPLFRDTGNYIVRVGHTTWTLKGVTLDTPYPDGHMRFHVEHRDLTAAEKQECAGSVVGGGMR